MTLSGANSNLTTTIFCQHRSIVKETQEPDLKMIGPVQDILVVSYRFRNTGAGMPCPWTITRMREDLLSKICFEQDSHTQEQQPKNGTMMQFGEEERVVHTHGRGKVYQ
jgi:hypothetical protein